MQIETKFDLGAIVVERATNLDGKIVMLGADHIGHYYEVEFVERIQGRRRHWKREAEIKLAPKSKQPK